MTAEFHGVPIFDDWDDTPGDPGGTEGKGMPFETLIYIYIWWKSGRKLDRVLLESDICNTWCCDVSLQVDSLRFGDKSILYHFLPIPSQLLGFLAMCGRNIKPFPSFAMPLARPSQAETWHWRWVTDGCLDMHHPDNDKNPELIAAILQKPEVFDTWKRTGHIVLRLPCGCSTIF